MKKSKSDLGSGEHHLKKSNDSKSGSKYYKRKTIENYKGGTCICFKRLTGY